MTLVAYITLWIFVFSLPWEVLGAINGVAIVARLTGGLALCTVLITALFRGRLRRLHAFHIAALLFLSWAALELLIFNRLPWLPAKFWTYIQLVFATWMIWEIARSWRQVLGLLLAYVLGAYVAAIDTIMLYRQAKGELTRFTAGATDPNDLAMTLALAVPMAWYLGIRHHKPLVRWICRAYLPVGILAIGLTGSRGGLLTTIVALVIVPLMMDRLTMARLVTTVFVLASAAGVTLRYIPDTIVERLGTTTEQVVDARLGGRFRIWVAGLNAFAYKPVVGYGTSGFKRAVESELGVRTHVAHNTYLSVLVEQGLVGLILYLMMFVAVFHAVLRLPKVDRRFALTLLATLAIAILPLTWEDRKPVWFTLAVLLVLSQARVSEGVVHPSAPLRGAVPPRRSAAARRRQPLTTPRDDGDGVL